MHGLGDASPAPMVREPLVREAVAAGVETGDARLSRVEEIKEFKLIVVSVRERALSARLARRPPKSVEDRDRVEVVTPASDLAIRDREH
jgi:hypothetical protein